MAYRFIFNDGASSISWYLSVSSFIKNCNIRCKFYHPTGCSASPHWMFGITTLDVRHPPLDFSIAPLDVQYHPTGCSASHHWMFSITPLDVQYFPNGCSVLPQQMFSVAPLDVQYHPSGCSISPHWMFSITPLDIQYHPTGCSTSHHWMFSSRCVYIGWRQFHIYRLLLAVCKSNKEAINLLAADSQLHEEQISKSESGDVLFSKSAELMH